MCSVVSVANEHSLAKGTDVTEHDDHSRLELHVGEALYALSKTYPTLTLCLVEGVQNTLDAGATSVYVGIDLVERRVAICDNGVGRTTEEFDEALLSVCMGVKPKGSLGKFGRGLIAGIHLCQTMTFVTSPKDASVVNNWLFIGEKLRRQRRNLTIPYSRLEDLPVLPEPFTRSRNDARPPGQKSPVRWRTMLLYDQLTSDRTTTTIDPDEVEQLIRTKLGPTMRKQGTSVFLKVREADGAIVKRRINPAAYDGKKLDVVTYQTPKAGKVEFDLYQARPHGGQRRGQVVIVQMGDDYPITLQELRAQAMGARWYSKDKHLAEIKEGIDALCSGYFEGVVRVEKIELAPERTKFELNDALTDTFTLIGDWYDKVGSSIVNDAREEQAASRYQKLGDQSLERLLHHLQTNPALAHLAHDLKGELPAARTNRPERQKREQETGSESKPRRERRVVVRPRQHSEGDTRSPVPAFLTFAYDLLEGSVRLWEYEAQSGVLTFNIRHPLWVKVDETGGKHTVKHDKQVMRLQEWLAFKLLLLLAEHIDPADFELHRAAIDKEVEYYIEVFILAGM